MSVLSLIYHLERLANNHNFVNMLNVNVYETSPYIIASINSRFLTKLSCLSLEANKTKQTSLVAEKLKTLSIRKGLKELFHKEPTLETPSRNVK